jgi:hypothetical protein
VPEFIYPTLLQMQQIQRTLLPRLEANRVVFQPNFFPVRFVDSHLLEWQQRDNFIGLQQARGLNGRPSQVRPIGGQVFQFEPGVYGEFQDVDERELTTRRQWGSFDAPINISDLVLEKQEHLLQRRLDRIELIIWTLLLNGQFSVPAPNGAVVHVDKFSTQTYSVGVPWSTYATATPLADIRAVQLLSRGYSVNFGASARMYMNRVTFNNILSNANALDLYGRRGIGGGTLGPDGVNAILAGEDLPGIVIYDEGYLDENGVFRLFLPNGKIVLIGARRDGEPVGEYRMTRNANNPGMAPGPYTKVVDDPDNVPRTVTVHDGHNGGPIIYFPSAIVNIAA